MSFRPCWSCGSEGQCFSHCECAKCIDPYAYQQWRDQNPEDYQDWINEQREEGFYPLRRSFQPRISRVAKVNKPTSQQSKLPFGDK